MAWAILSPANDHCSLRMESGINTRRKERKGQGSFLYFLRLDRKKTGKTKPNEAKKRRRREKINPLFFSYLAACINLIGPLGENGKMKAKTGRKGGKRNKRSLSFSLFLNPRNAFETNSFYFSCTPSSLVVTLQIVAGTIPD